MWDIVIIWGYCGIRLLCGVTVCVGRVCGILCVCGVVCVWSAALAKMTAKTSILGSGNRGGQVKSPDVSERGCLLLGLRRFQHFISSGK